jgi:hypothetical protein
VFGGALAGVAISLPAHHRDDDARDVVKLVGTISALVLSLLIASAHSSYGTQESEVQQLGVHIAQLDAILAHYGPEASDSRAQLRRIVEAELARMWPEAGAPRMAMPAPPISGRRKSCMTR